MRGLDWYGSTVNVAARLADQAEPNQALISGTTVQAAMGELSRPPRHTASFCSTGSISRSSPGD